MPGRCDVLFLAPLAALPACAGSAQAPPDAASDVQPPRDAVGDGVNDVSPVCPLSPPAIDAACALPASFPCSFGDPCSFDRYACRGGRWAEVVVDGAAPEPCPAVAPATGSTCASCGRSYRCDYAARCGATTTSTCSGGHWLTGTGACDAASPSDAGEPPG